MLNRYIASIVLSLISVTSIASPNLLFNDSSAVINGSGNHTSMHLSSHGVNVGITAWSSSWADWNNGNDPCWDGNMYDQCIQRAELTKYGSNGLGTINQDEAGTRSDYTSSNLNPNHSIDNNYEDFDMILLSFDEEVNISSVFTGWNYQYDSLQVGKDGTTTYSNRTQNEGRASIMAFENANNNNSINQLEPFSQSDTWQSILGKGWTSINEDFGVTNPNAGGLAELAVTSNSEAIYSKYWLIGAAHNISRNAGNLTDHIKLAGVNFAKQVTSQTTDSTSVHAPATGAFIVAFACMFLYRRQQS